MKKQIAIFGSGGFGREVAALIEQINAAGGHWELIGFFDDAGIPGTLINGYPLLGSLRDVNQIGYRLDLVLALGDPAAKRKVHNLISNENISYPVLIHPGALIGNPAFVEIGAGTVITAGNILTVNIRIGKHVLLNLACTVGHDTHICDYASLMPAVNISGDVVLGEAAYVGTGAKIINGIEIGENTIVGAGALVAKSLPANCTAVGIPAKPIKFH